MNKEIFINELKKELKDFSQPEIDDIVFEYETEIEEQINRGISEEEVLNKLGNPHDIALEFLANKEPNLQLNDDNKIKNIIIFTLLQLFNIIFVLWAYLTLIAVEITLFVTSIMTITLSIWSVMYFSPFELAYTLTLTVFLLSVGLLILVLMIKYTKKYYQFNKKLFRRIK